MKIACVLTTIHVPTALALYAKHGPDVHFIVIGDRKTPDIPVTEFLQQHVPSHAYYGIDWQHKLGYKCSELIGENCIQRRNIGFLEALKWGADAIVTIDDDNYPLEALGPIRVGYFNNARCLAKGVLMYGLQASSPSGWFDPGSLLMPAAEARGFPHTRRAQPYFEPIVDAKVGVVSGTCLGDPDIGACLRIATGPTCHGVSELLRSGVVVNPGTRTVFNSQNTAFLRELAPAMFMMPGVGRYDDIYASLICQRVMREKGYVVHHGRPFVWQQRNAHNLGDDMLMEIGGVRTIERIAERLDGTDVHSKASVAAMSRALYAGLEKLVPEHSIEAAMLWCDDIEQVMK